MRLLISPRLKAGALRRNLVITSDATATTAASTPSDYQYSDTSINESLANQTNTNNTAVATIAVTSPSLLEPEQFKVNLHILESCNFHCKGCFSHFNQPALLKVEQWKQIIDKLVASKKVYAVNFAGGEPLMYKGLAELIAYAHKQGLQCSLITNGSLISSQFLADVAGKLQTLGVSVDSLKSDTNVKLGRCARHGNGFTPDALTHLAQQLPQYGIEFKINTVVSKLNWQEQFSDFFAREAIISQTLKRWKILKIKLFEYPDPKDPQKIHSNQELLPTDKEFAFFCREQPLSLSCGRK